MARPLAPQEDSPLILRYPLISHDLPSSQYSSAFVPPPACTPDRFTAKTNATGTNFDFHFDRLGVRVPAVLISPWIQAGTIVDRTFDRASIPASVTKFFLGDFSPLSPRETTAGVFIEPKGVGANLANNLLSLGTVRTNCPEFDA